MGLSDGISVQDVVIAEMVDCTPEPPKTVQLPAIPETPSPTAQAAHATIEQVGADPPPVVTHG